MNPCFRCSVGPGILAVVRGMEMVRGGVNQISSLKDRVIGQGEGWFVVP